MGTKCFGGQGPVEVDNSYPKFSYLNTESATKMKFIEPGKIETIRIPQQPDKRLPLNSLTCKLQSNQYLVVGGLSLYRWSLCADVYELDFNSLKMISKVECPYVPYGGSLYLHNRQVYLIGAAQNTVVANTEVEFDALPYPFRKYQHVSLFNENKTLKPGNVYRYSLVRDRWKEVAMQSEFWDAEVKEEEKIMPNKLMLPATCKMEDKVLFFSGLVEKGNDWEPNENIYWFSLESRKVGVMSVKFTFGGFTEMKCARVTKKRFLLLGGYDAEGVYNRVMFRYTADTGIKGKTEQLKGEYFFCDNNMPVGKYRYAIFFGFPNAFLTRYKTNRREYLSIRSE